MKCYQSLGLGVQAVQGELQAVTEVVVNRRLYSLHYTSATLFFMLIDNNHIQETACIVWELHS